MTQILEHTKLQGKDQFAEDQHNQVTRIINNIIIQQVETEEQFKSSLQEIKEKVLLKPVIFKEPVVIGHVYGEKKSRKVFTVDVEIQFTGSVGLFSYSLRSSYLVHSSGRVYQPEENRILIKVESPEIPEKDKIINKIEDQMQLTNEITKGNNAFIEGWNVKFATVIENKLKEHKAKLKGLYV
jgi:hypothetical protein